MRRLPSSFFSILLTAILFALPACDSGESDGTDDPPDAVECDANANLSARVDGSPFCSFPLVTTIEFAPGGEGTVLPIRAGANSLNPRSLSLVLDLNRLDVGTYDFANPESGVFAGYLTVSNDYDAESGTLRLTTLSDDRVAGTFAFVARDEGDEVVVTDGVFDFPLPN